MIKLTSLNDSSLQVVFDSTTIQTTPTLRGWNETNSITEHIKPYYIRATIDPNELTVGRMTTDQYDNLIQLFFFDGNSFEIDSSEGDTFTNCYIREKFSLTKTRDKETGKFFYTGTLPIGVR